MECNGLLEDILAMAPQSTVFDPWGSNEALRVLGADQNGADQNECYLDAFGDLLLPDRCFPGPFGSVQQLSDSAGSSLREEFALDFQVPKGNLLPSYSFAEEVKGVTELLDSMPTGTCKKEVDESPERRAGEEGGIVFAAVGGRKNRGRKAEGQCSKNLMAERRRRKRVNDRLTMLRSIVPKISRMDRTSILGDTIHYVKDLLQKITDLQEGDMIDPNQPAVSDVLKDMKANEMLVGNTPKFEVERENGETRIEMCCGDRPGLLLSTISTLESLGVEIQGCVISCFNDFALQATCSDGKMVGAEELKQALFRNAG
ncbi:hypothetical protein MLD38_000983 [Melastoma candidum]|uniref:Uncharacterized protein n=1 Tax=Melastoma candidum TaxID=119954 RepID=A0ACB9SBU6_9MYRT|nr:hypothetical protein MLD38_000983 [Melastoma candidum]